VIDNGCDNTGQVLPRNRVNSKADFLVNGLPPEREKALLVKLAGIVKAIEAGKLPPKTSYPCNAGFLTKLQNIKK